MHDLADKVQVRGCGIEGDGGALVARDAAPCAPGWQRIEAERGSTILCRSERSPGPPRFPGGVRSF